MTIELTHDEIGILMDAVKVWEKDPSTQGTMKGMFSDLFEVISPDNKGRDREELRQRIEVRRRREQSEIDAMVQLRHESSILLQAKLINARHSTQ
jgi:hypothetical protein